MWIQDVDHTWIASVCRRLSRVTGYPTTFAPVVRDTAASLLEYSWTGELLEDGQPIGGLRVALPRGCELDARFLCACETVDVAAQLVQEVLNCRGRRFGSLNDEAPGQAVLSGETHADSWSASIDRVLDVGLRLTGFRAAALYLLDSQSSVLRLRSERTRDRNTVLMYGRPLDQAPFDTRALQHQPTVIRRQAGEFSAWLPEGMSLGVCRGLETTHGTQGTLWVFDRRDRRLTLRDEQALDSIVIRLSSLLEQADAAQEHVRQRQLRAELRIASEAQPDQQVSLVGADGWCDISGRTESAREVGGDLCEVVPLGNNRVLIAIGDAAGHSIPAAMVMATMRGALRVMLDEDAPDGLQPERIVTRLNRVLHGIVEAHQFMTLSCAILDRRANRLTIANAGHPPPLLIRGNDVVPIESSGLLLGVVDDAEYHARHVELKRGDLLAFYTDGISEAANSHRVLFRSDGIAETIRRHRRRSPDEIVQAVWAAFQAHRDDEGPADDRTLLVARYVGLPTEVVPRGACDTLPPALSAPSER